MLEHYSDILKTIRGLDPSAHIGGGAVRDTLLERPIKDVDLFLGCGPGQSILQDAAKLLRSDFGFVKVGEWKNYEMFSDPAVVAVAKFEKADETIPICLIGLKRAARGMPNNCRRFDFGICMAAWDGDKIHVAPEYKTDVESKTFTLCRADNWAQFYYSMSRFDKMTADRYAGWKLAVPAEFEAMAKDYAFRKTHYYNDRTDEWMLREVVDGPQLLTPKAR
jgi:hypothetical protein